MNSFVLFYTFLVEAARGRLRPRLQGVLAPGKGKLLWGGVQDIILLPQWPEVLRHSACSSCTQGAVSGHVPPALKNSTP